MSEMTVNEATCETLTVDMRDVVSLSLPALRAEWEKLQRIQEARVKWGPLPQEDFQQGVCAGMAVLLLAYLGEAHHPAAIRNAHALVEQRLIDAEEPTILCNADVRFEEAEANADDR